MSLKTGIITLKQNEEPYDNVIASRIPSRNGSMVFDGFTGLFGLPDATAGCPSEKPFDPEEKVRCSWPLYLYEFSV